jgi:hypothetical protein
MIAGSAHPGLIRFPTACKSPKVRNAWLAVSLRKRQDHAMVYI